MPSRRHNSAMLDSPRRPSRTIRIFSSDECRLRVARRMFFTIRSDGEFRMHGFLSHLHSLMVTMSQKSSVPQAAKSVSQALMSDTFQQSAHASTLSSSQKEHDLVTVKTCRDHEVLTSLKAAIDRSLQARSVLARGMHAGNVHLEAVWIDQPAVICSTTVSAKGIREQIVYTVALEGSSYVIKFGGEPGGSKLFPYQLEVRPINMDMPPGALGRLRPVRSDALIQPRRLATLRSTEYHHRHAGGRARDH